MHDEMSPQSARRLYYFSSFLALVIAVGSLIVSHAAWRKIMEAPKVTAREIPKEIPKAVPSEPKVVKRELPKTEMKEVSVAPKKPAESRPAPAPVPKKEVAVLKPRRRPPKPKKAVSQMPAERSLAPVP